MDEVWTTRDGKAIEVKDMDEAHVRNALRTVLRARRKAKEQAAAASEEEEEFVRYPAGCDEHGSVD